MFKVKSRLAISSTVAGTQNRDNGELGPFEKRPEAERALIALCQAGQATSGEIVEARVFNAALKEAADNARSLDGEDEVFVCKRTRKGNCCRCDGDPYKAPETGRACRCDHMHTCLAHA